jgi:hypothetical protein
MRAVWYARATRFCSYAVAGAIILLCALSTAYSLRLVFRSYHAVLFWDQWSTVELFDRLLGGSATLSDFIADHNEHRLLVPRLIFALDLWLTDARNGVNFAAILICQAIHVALFHHMISQRVGAQAVRWALTAFVTLLLFCIVQKENFTWGFQIQFVGVFLLFTLAAWTLATAQARSAEDAPRWGLAIAGLLCGLAAAFTMANGVVALFAIAVVFAAARLLNRLTAVVAVVAIVLIAGYAATFTPNPGHTPLGFALQNPLIFIQFVAIYLGCLFAPLGETFALVAGAIGLAFAAAAGIALAARPVGPDRVNLTLIAILVFAILTAAMTAVGRSSFGFEQAVASRYATPSAIFWAAAVTLAVLTVLGRTDPQPGRIVAALVLILAVTLVSLYAIFWAQFEYRFLRQFRVMDLQHGADALLSEVDDDAALRKLFPQLERMKTTLIPILKARRINVFARPPAWPLGAQVPQAQLVTAPERCRGAIERITAVQGIPGAFQLDGWAWDNAARQPFDRIVTLSEDRRVTGYGSSGAPRFEVAAANPGVHGGYIGWTAYGRAPAGRNLGVYGLTGDGELCHIATRPAPAP